MIDETIDTSDRHHEFLKQVGPLFMDTIFIPHKYTIRWGQYLNF